MYPPDPYARPQPATPLALSVAVLALPCVGLFAAAGRYGSSTLAVGALAVALGGVLLLLRFRDALRPPASGSAVLLYLTALGWLWFATRDNPDAAARAGRGALLVGAVALFVGHDLARSGLGPQRKTRRLCDLLARRVRWPDDVDEYPQLPEVRGLRDALGDDPAPVLGLLGNPRPQVQLAALAALQGRAYWRTAEAATLLAAARMTNEPTVRAAAVAALAPVDDAAALAELGSYLRDPTPDVRRAAAAVMLTGGGRRWPVVREFVKEYLAEPAVEADGALPGAAGQLPPLAVCDLTTWAAEAPPLADRAILSLIDNYAAELTAGDRPELAAHLGEQVTAATTPPALRVELAALLRGFGLISPHLLDRMTDVDQPGPVRLVAAETLLAADPSDPTAIEVLRGLGRQPNRETALTIARLMQSYLGLDMGLPADGEAVPAQSKAAAEAARRVLAWATNRPGEQPAQVPPHMRLSRPLSAPTLSGLKGTSLRPGVADRGPSGTLWSPR